MASVETPKARAQAKALGWRTFRTRTEGAPVLKGEAQCPYPRVGLRCGACDGRRRRLRGDITEVAHGRFAPRFTAAIRKDAGLDLDAYRRLRQVKDGPLLPCRAEGGVSDLPARPGSAGCDGPPARSG